MIALAVSVWILGVPVRSHFVVEVPHSDGWCTRTIYVCDEDEVSSWCGERCVEVRDTYEAYVDSYSHTRSNRALLVWLCGILLLGGLVAGLFPEFSESAKRAAEPTSFEIQLGIGPSWIRRLTLRLVIQLGGSVIVAVFLGAVVWGTLDEVVPTSWTPAAIVEDREVQLRLLQAELRRQADAEDAKDADREASAEGADEEQGDVDSSEGDAGPWAVGASIKTSTSTSRRSASK